MRLLFRHISSSSWPAVGTRPSALLTVRVLCRPSPSSCLTDLTTQRAVLWVHTTNLSPNRFSTTCWQSLRWKRWPKLRIADAFLFIFFYFSSGWVGLDVGGGVAAVSLRASPRHRAPDRTQLLPRQDISGGDATAQDASTVCLKRHYLMTF